MDQERHFGATIAPSGKATKTPDSTGVSPHSTMRRAIGATIWPKAASPYAAQPKDAAKSLRRPC